MIRLPGDLRNYGSMMKRREKESFGVELSTFHRQLKLTFADGKVYTKDAIG